MIHECLEGWWGIAEAKEHDCGFIKAEGSDKCCFPLVFLLNANVVITPLYIKLHEKSGVFHVIDQLGNQGEWVPIVDGVAVEITIILTRAKSSNLLRDKEERSSLWGFGGYNTSSL